MLFYLTIKKISENSEIEIVWRGGATSWHIPGMAHLCLHPLFRPWFRLLSKSEVTLAEN